jgi:pimeloyl-ACP methyl ester carboxylesterase
MSKMGKMSRSAPALLEGAHDVPDLGAAFRAFRAAHPCQQCDVAGVTWHYLTGGQGAEHLLLLPGAPGLGETSFQTLLHFAGRYRMLAPSYPAACTSVSALVEGLVGLLDAEGIARAHIEGGSFSGMIADHLARRYPERVGKLILSHTGVPQPRRFSRFPLWRVLMLGLPMPLLRGLLRLGIGVALAPAVGQSEGAFWMAYFLEVVQTLTRADYLARLAVLHDLERRERNAGALPPERRTWQGQVLIIEADDDALVTPQGRRALKACYPQAQVHTFHQTGHSAWMTRTAEYLHIMEVFLQE